MNVDSRESAICIIRQSPNLCYENHLFVKQHLSILYAGYEILIDELIFTPHVSNKIEPPFWPSWNAFNYWNDWQIIDTSIDNTLVPVTDCCGIQYLEIRENLYIYNAVQFPWSCHKCKICRWTDGYHVSYGVIIHMTATSHASWRLISPLTRLVSNICVTNIESPDNWHTNSWVNRVPKLSFCERLSGKI